MYSHSPHMDVTDFELFPIVEMGFLLHLLRPEDLFINIGANSGAYSILATSVIGATTIAVEPALSSYSRLISNFKLNSVTKDNLAINVG